MADVLLTYALHDDQGGVVSFAIAELDRAGLAVRPDRRDPRSPEGLWSQLGAQLDNPRKVSAWCLYLTDDSLADRRFTGELASALAEAGRRRPRDLPTAILLPASVSSEVPPGLRARVAVNLAEQYWAQRLRAAAEGRQPEIPPPGVPPYVLTIHQWGCGDERRQALEIRPRAGAWSPFAVSIPAVEYGAAQPRLCYGPRGAARVSEDVSGAEAAGGVAGGWWTARSAPPADRFNSYFLRHTCLPGMVKFGVDGGYVQYTVRLRPVRQ